ncbi:hypothetical protein ACFLTX_03660 [Chloroflexota bacterium]
MDVIKKCFNQIISISVLVMIFLSGCQFNPFASSNQEQDLTFGSPHESIPTVEIFFAVTVPEIISNNESIYLSIVDEVTGLPYNTENHQLLKGDDFHYYIALPFPLGSIIKYRYYKQGISSILEDDSRDQPVRYRMYYVGGPGELMDYVSGWSDTISNNKTGRITGRVVDGITTVGIPDVLIAAGGRQTFSDSSGEFVLEGIPEGTNNLVAYSVDGNYQPFQQGAVVSSGKRTPVEVKLTASNFVNVIFTVSLPANTVPNAPVRIAGNLHQLGNSFGDLKGGVNNIYSDLPVLSPLPDGRFTYSVMLPVGMDIRYKYTMGDGLWNAEHDADGEFKVRQLIVPEVGGIVQDNVESWQAGSNAPIIFDFSVPQDTPQTDRISIQLNPSVWTEPIQMWPIGNGRWIYQLFGPFNYFESLTYTYCRNDLCNLAVDPKGSNQKWIGTVHTSQFPQTIQEGLLSWKWTANYQHSENLIPDTLPRNLSFWTGFELTQAEINSWKEYFPSALKVMQESGANTIVIRPTWSLISNNPVELSLKPGLDLFGNDLNSQFALARDANMRIVIYPSINFQGPNSEWWTESKLDSGWWDNWFSRYRSFILYYSDLAAHNNIDTLILGGDWVMPSLPGGTLPNGNDSTPLVDSSERWRSLISEIRQHYSGKLYWSVDYPGGLENAPALINELDGIYLLWSAPVAGDLNTSMLDMKNQAGNLLDNEIAQIKSLFQKPLVIALAYPSISGSGLGCFKESQSYCKEWELLNQPDPNLDGNEINLLAQQDVYQAILLAINERNWIDGVMSRGFYGTLALQDGSASIYGKPAFTLVNHWFNAYGNK